MIARRSPSSARSSREQRSVTGTFETPQPSSCAASITKGPDGAFWLGQLVLSGDRIGRLTTAAVFSNEYAIPRGGGSEPLGITTGPDGNLWFTEYAAFHIGQLTPAGAFTEFLLPGIMLFACIWVAKQRRPWGSPQPGTKV